jgi:hypothetical protein
MALARVATRGTLRHVRDPLKRFVVVSHRSEALSPRIPSNEFGTRQITRMYLLGHVSGPLANSNRKELGPPLGLPDNSSKETSCSSPIKGRMTHSPLPPRGETTKGRMNQKSRPPSIDLLPHAKARGLSSQTMPKVPIDRSKIERDLLLGRRRRRYPSLRPSSPCHCRRQDDRRGPPFVLLAARRRPTMKSLHPTFPPDLEAHVGFDPL